MADFDKGAFAQEAERRRAAGLKIFGKTFPVKDRIKEGGGIWDSRMRCWLLPSEEFALSLGAEKKEGKHGVYWLLGTPKGHGDNGGAPSSTPPAAIPTPGQDCPACGGEPLDDQLYCWECGYRGA